MRTQACLHVVLAVAGIVKADQWPYNRYLPKATRSGRNIADKNTPEIVSADDTQSKFLEWFLQVTGEDRFLELFPEKTVPSGAKTVPGLLEQIEVPNPEEWESRPRVAQQGALLARKVLSNLDFPLEPICTMDRAKWWYRTYDGSCNWLKLGEADHGQVGSAKARDFGQYGYADGFFKPRTGPNPRAVSNAFFRRNETLFYEHTPLLLGLVEFIMHDVTYSKDSETEFVDVPVPADEQEFPPNTTFRIWRSIPVPGSGTSRQNPRENANWATTWLDISSLYGSDAVVAKKLRSFQGGKLLDQKLTTRGRASPESYLPFNTMGVPTRNGRGTDSSTLFAGGDPRTNEDWVMLGVHTLFLREHNRLCDILAGKHPEYDDEELYQTTRLLFSAKYEMIANSYQMAYWNEKMPWPRDDGFPLFRQIHGKSFIDINPANTYPWPIVTKAGKPMVVSSEMAVVYRFHELIIPHFPIVNSVGQILWNQSLFDTGFDAQGFINAGLENVLRGMLSTSIPNFKSGVDESFRSAGKYGGAPFDIVTWSIVREREQGLPTFNNYFRMYNRQDPNVTVPIRKTFGDFSTNLEMVRQLKLLYATPDDVDLVVGVQLDEEYFPGTTLPKSACIISLFSLFGMGNSDRFNVGFALMRCILVDKPWDCHPSNALEDLLWHPDPRPGFPNFRTLDMFWMNELDLQSHGQNLLWRLITENTDIRCLQIRPLFPVNETTNPILCALPEEKLDIKSLAATALEISLSLIKIHSTAIIVAIATGLVAWFVYLKSDTSKFPPVMYGWPVLGEALRYQKDPKSLFLEGMAIYRNSISRCFGIKLAQLTHYILIDPRDLEMMRDDNPYEVKFALRNFMESINFALITQKDNFDSDLHTRLIRNHLGDPDTLKEFAISIDAGSKLFLEKHPPSASYKNMNEYIHQYIVFTVSYCIVGPVDGFDDPALLTTFLAFNDDAIKAMGISAMLPKFLQWIAGVPVTRHLKTIRRVLSPIIKKMRASADPARSAFLPLILDSVDDDSRASDLVAIAVWGGLVNMQFTFASTLLDIVNQPGLQDEIVSSLKDASPKNLDTFRITAPWSKLRAAMFESIRLSGPVTGPARLTMEETRLVSDPSIRLPKGQAVTMSAFYTHRTSQAWGVNAATYNTERYLNVDPLVGTNRYIIWGLSGPHMCPGRWFGQAIIQIMTKNILEGYVFEQVRRLEDEEKYQYSGGMLSRTAVETVVKRRPQGQPRVWTTPVETPLKP